jgi:hypothetical protein
VVEIDILENNILDTIHPVMAIAYCSDYLIKKYKNLFLLNSISSLTIIVTIRSTWISIVLLGIVRSTAHHVYRCWILISDSTNNKSIPLLSVVTCITTATASSISRFYCRIKCIATIIVTKILTTTTNSAIN